ncbi:hypothetical protein BV20DRAFT_469020 [Pilatotrama ljubarskyi]|nr:hypothetical protein BV20DRAFT_469020 [Pilatotrama ljubarskyi]
MPRISHRSSTCVVHSKGSSDPILEPRHVKRTAHDTSSICSHPAPYIDRLSVRTSASSPRLPHLEWFSSSSWIPATPTTPPQAQVKTSLRVSSSTIPATSRTQAMHVRQSSLRLAMDTHTRTPSSRPSSRGATAIRTLSSKSSSTSIKAHPTTLRYRMAAWVARCLPLLIPRGTPAVPHKLADTTRGPRADTCLLLVSCLLLLVTVRFDSATTRLSLTGPTLHDLPFTPRPASAGQGVRSGSYGPAQSSSSRSPPLYDRQGISSSATYPPSRHGIQHPSLSHSTQLIPTPAQTYHGYSSGSSSPGGSMPIVASIPPASGAIAPQERFYCDKCDKSFGRAHDKKRHYESAHLQTHHECRFCHKCFSRNDSLKRHQDNGCEKDPSFQS